MDQIYSPITSHHTVAHIEKVIDICDFYLIAIPFFFISCWVVFIIYNSTFSKKKKNQDPEVGDEAQARGRATRGWGRVLPKT